MRVLHLPYHYFPELVGGTEVYVAGLVRETAALGIESAVAAPGEREQQYTHDGTTVFRFPVNPQPPDIRELYDEGDPTTLPYVRRILDEVRPDVVHLHGQNRGLSLRLVREAKSRGLKVVLTTHIPSAVCVRGTLMRFGREVCDGVWSEAGCVACTLQSKGLPAPLVPLLARMPRGVSEAAVALGRAGVPLRLKSLLSLMHETTMTLYDEVDAVVAVCQWLRDMLASNGVPESKLLLSRQGVGAAVAASGTPPVGPPYRLAFLGRLSNVKGVHVILEALQQVPGEAPILIDLYGTASEPEYQARLDPLLAANSRARLCPPLRPHEVVEKLAGYHALLVPSTWLETGPLVVYEAAQARVPVLGSNVGGIAELVRHDVDGLLLPMGDATAWARAIQRIVSEPELLPRLRAAIRPPRTMADAAREMAELYGRLLKPWK